MNIIFIIFIKKVLKFILIINILIVNLFYYKNYSFVKNKSNNICNKHYKISNNEFNDFNYLRKINDLKVIDVRYYYSFKYNIVKLDYSFGFYDKKENLISPTDISLYNNYK